MPVHSCTGHIMSYAKTAEKIDMPFRGLEWAKRNRVQSIFQYRRILFFEGDPDVYRLSDDAH